jgi:hypothetical protein
MVAAAVEVGPPYLVLRVVQVVVLFLIEVILTTLHKQTLLGLQALVFKAVAAQIILQTLMTTRERLEAVALSVQVEMAITHLLVLIALEMLTVEQVFLPL